MSGKVKKLANGVSLSKKLAQLINGRGVAVVTGPVKTTIRKGTVLTVSPESSNSVNEIRVTVGFLDGGKLGLEGCERAQDKLTIEQTYVAMRLYQDMVANGLTGAAENATCDEKVWWELKKIWRTIESFPIHLSRDSNQQNDSKDSACEPLECETLSVSCSPSVDSSSSRPLASLHSEVRHETIEAARASTVLGDSTPKGRWTAEHLVTMTNNEVPPQMQSLHQFQEHCLYSKHHLVVKRPYLTKRQRIALGRKAGIANSGSAKCCSYGQLGFFMREFKKKPQDSHHQIKTLDDKVNMIGLRVVRQFGSTLYFGTVDLFRSVEPYGDTNMELWRVRYDDGDTEDYERKELLKFRCQYSMYRPLDPSGSTNPDPCKIKSPLTEK